MKLYLAHNFAARDWLRTEVIPKIRLAGHRVQANWIINDSHVDLNNKQASAQEDVDDIDGCDGLVLFVDQHGDRPGKGKYFELGFAYALGIDTFLIGKDDSCVFYSLPEMTQFATIEEFLDDINDRIG